MSKVNSEKVESCSRIKDGNRRWRWRGLSRKDLEWFLEDLYNINTKIRLQSICMALVGFGEVIISKES